MARLQGKHALVTGANGGIALATVAAYVSEGAICSCVDVQDAPNEALNTLQSEHPDRINYAPLDVRDTIKVAHHLDSVTERYGTVNVLYNNAAIFDMAPLLDSDETMYDRLFDVNVKGMFFVMQAVLKRLVEAGETGSIINFSSQAGRRGESLVSHYCATKAAVISYTQSAALAMAEHGIRVNAIAPGVIETPMWQTVDQLFARYEQLNLGEKKAAVGQAVPLGRMGTPQDLVGLSIFLASDEAEYMTGQTINLDGGNVMS